MKTTDKRPLIILTAGGTGGHVYPAEALAEELERRGYNLMLITDGRGKDNYKGKLGEIPNKAVWSGGVVGKSVLFKCKSLLKTCVGIAQAVLILLRYRPVCVVGFGGYASFPASMAALLLGTDLVLHEQNSVMSRTNRYLCRYAALVAQSFRHVRRVPEGVKSVLCGMPVRASIVAEAGRVYPSLGPHDPIQLLVLGGSQGAKIFGEVVPQAIATLPENLRKKIKIFQQCRKGEEEQIEKAYKNSGCGVTVRHFFEDMPMLYASSHLVISRSGASSVSEIAVVGVPSILVPLPTAADNHQMFNTTDLVEAGGAEMIEQKDFTPQKLQQTLEKLFADEPRLQKMAACAAKAGIKDAAGRFANAIEKELIRA